MRNFLNKTFVGFMAGLISACILYFILLLFVSMVLSLMISLSIRLYRLMIRSVVYRLSYLHYHYQKIFLLKVHIITLAVILFNFLVKIPLAGLIYKIVSLK